MAVLVEPLPLALLTRKRNELQGFPSSNLLPTEANNTPLNLELDTNDIPEQAYSSSSASTKSPLQAHRLMKQHRSALCSRSNASHEVSHPSVDITNESGIPGLPHPAPSAHEVSPPSAVYSSLDLLALFHSSANYGIQRARRQGRCHSHARRHIRHITDKRWYQIVVHYLYPRQSTLSSAALTNDLPLTKAPRRKPWEEDKPPNHK